MFVRRTRQRGIVLLVVLSLLVLFSLLITTFVIVAGNYRTAAVMSASGAAKQLNAELLIEQTFHSLLVDTTDTQSPLQGHGLLRDMWGDDGFVAQVTGISPVDPTNPTSAANQAMRNQIIQVQLSSPLDYLGRPYTMHTLVGYYNGCVLSFVDGPAQGMTARVTGFDPVNRLFRILPMDANTTRLPQLGDRVVVNGRPFNGTGFGYNDLTRMLNVADPGPDATPGTPDDYPFPAVAALLPNHASPVDSPFPLRNYLRGGADESYDAADYQNLHLAAIIPAQQNPVNSIVPFDANAVNVLPSFHRPAMINYLLQQVIRPLVESDLGGVSDNQLLAIFLSPFGADRLPATGDEGGVSPATQAFIANIKQQAILRPLPEFHPNFDGSNQAFSPAGLGLAAANLVNPYVTGPWDVDNDGDGVRDGIWMDTGLPIMEDAQGNLFKPLVSVLCIDLDGRLNINAHGSDGHQFAFNPPTLPNPLIGLHPVKLARGAPFTTLTPGMGTGPADINLGILFGRNFTRLLEGVPALSTPGRYGLDQRPGRVGFDNSSISKLFDYPDWYFDVTSPANNTVFQSPPDLFGDIALGVDHRGQPEYSVELVTAVGGLLPSRRADHPYELDLLTPSSLDQPFTMDELEPILRYHDADVQSSGNQIFPQRLTRLFQNPDPAPALSTVPPRPNLNLLNLLTDDYDAPLRRRLITTHSFDLPVPNMFEPADLAGFDTVNPLARIIKPRAQVTGVLFENSRFQHISEIMRARLIQSVVVATAAGPRELGLGWGGDATFRTRWLTMPAARDQYELTINRTLAGLDPSLSQNFPLTSPLSPPDMLAPEVAFGLRMDLNRPFGDGRDNNNPPNAVVDEPAPVELDVLPGGLSFDHDNDGDYGQNGADPDAYLARYNYARHLYLLMMALKDPQWFTEDDLDGDGLRGAADPEDTSQMIAQWAINVVDFRDADSIMTPFEYDAFPFAASKGPDGAWGTGGDDDGDGDSDNPGEALWRESDDLPPWSVDGWVLNSPTGANQNNPSQYPDRRIVWGCERPELLITETLAFHDRRTQDLDTPNEQTTYQDPMTMEIGETDVANGGLNDFDQALRPRGALFVELYNPWASESVRRPGELHFIPGTNPQDGWQQGVKLNKTTPDGSPVWRMIVTPDIEDPDLPNSSVTIERTIYFTPIQLLTPPLPALLSVGTVANHDPGFAISASLAGIPGGRYAVVGTYHSPPRDERDPATDTDGPPVEYVTEIGEQTMPAPDPETTRRIVMHAELDANQNWFYVRSNPDESALPNRLLYAPNTNSDLADIQPTVAIPMQGLNVSESNLYPAATVPPDAYVPAIDLPFDQDPNIGLQLDPRMSTDGTHPAFRQLVLQRLANPLLPYDPVLNPYRSIDRMAIDLTIFNGVNTMNGNVTDENIQEVAYQFMSRERGIRAPSGSEPFRIIWSPITQAPQATLDGAITGHYFDHELVHTLGFQNSTYGSRFVRDFNAAPTTNQRQWAPNNDDNYVGAPNTNPFLAGDNLGGAVFPWLNWLNRPFVNQYELLQVPRSRSSQLLADFGFLALSRTRSAYLGEDGTTPPDPDDRAEFGHLLNFFASTLPPIPPPPVAPQGSRWAAPMETSRPESNFAAILDFTHVPSKFAGTEKFLDPLVFREGNIPGTEHLHPPFNHVSRYREPGRVNVNTVYSQWIYNAIRGGPWDPLHQPVSGLPAPWVWPGTGPPWYQFVDSRRGFGERPAGPGAVPPAKRTTLPQGFIPAGRLIPLFTALPPGDFDPIVHFTPTIFNNPFRGFGDAALVPTPRWVRPPTEAGLLRSDRLNLMNNPLDGIQPWPIAPTPTGSPDIPLFSRSSAEQHTSSILHSHFRYDALQRFGNLVTTRSNVYAIWITVGFFEVETGPPTRINAGPTSVTMQPFGYQLGRELGWDTGEIRRHRGFFVVDRSIPVAFEPGKVHNAEKTVLIKRFIE